MRVQFDMGDIFDQHTGGASAFSNPLERTNAMHGGGGGGGGAATAGNSGGATADSSPSNSNSSSSSSSSSSSNPQRERGRPASGREVQPAKARQKATKQGFVKAEKLKVRVTGLCMLRRCLLR